MRLPFNNPETIRLFAKFFSAVRFAAEAMPLVPDVLKFQEQQQNSNHNSIMHTHT